MCRLIARVCSHVVHGVVVGWAVFELMRARVLQVRGGDTVESLKLLEKAQILSSSEVRVCR